MKDKLQLVLTVIENKYHHYLNAKAQRQLQANKGLWKVLTDYINRLSSRGCSYSDYWVLYQYVRKNKPKEILELGTGVTTIVMAYALEENGFGRITSMEDIEKYTSMAIDLLPSRFKKNVDIVHSPKVEKVYQIFRGVAYKEIPDRSYDFIFVDGPSTRSITDDVKTFDFDLIHIIEKAKKPITAIIDNRKSTCFVLQNILEDSKFHFDYTYSMGFVNSCTNDDLKDTDQIIRSLGRHHLRRGSIRRIIS